MPARRDMPLRDLPGRQSGEIPVPYNARGREKWQAAGRPMTIEQYRAIQEQADPKSADDDDQEG